MNTRERAAIAIGNTHDHAARKIGVHTEKARETLAAWLDDEIKMKATTARRYCESDREPCTVFFSANGVIWWNHFSYDMQRLGLYYYPYDATPPAGSKTAEFWERARDGEDPEKISGRVLASRWFQWPKREYLWEEVTALGGTGRAITQLTPDN